MADLVIVSMHDKGFPMADFYEGHGETDANEFRCISPSPDNFFTMKRGDTLEMAQDRAKETWPNAVVVFADDEDDE